jgi:hypothetical protein
MPKRRADADTRRFYDEFEAVRVSRFRAEGTVDPARAQALIRFPSGKTKLLGVAHTKFPNGGGWSYFVCPGCGGRRMKLWLVDDAPRCYRCCEKLNILHRSRYGFGREARRREQEKELQRLIGVLETPVRLTLKPDPPPVGHRMGPKRDLFRGEARIRRKIATRLIRLRLKQLASQQASERADDADTLKTFIPSAETRMLIDVGSIWRANSTETLQRALDAAFVQIMNALESEDFKRRLAAAKIILRGRLAGDHGIA